MAKARRSGSSSAPRHTFDRLRQIGLHLLGFGTAVAALLIHHLYTSTHPPEGPQDVFAHLVVSAGIPVVLVGLAFRNVLVRRLTTYGWLTAALALGVVLLSGHPAYYGLRSLTLLLVGGGGAVLGLSALLGGGGPQEEEPGA